MSLYSIYTQLNKGLDALEEKLQASTSPEFSQILEELEALTNYHESILENWLFFDERLQKIQALLTEDTQIITQTLPIGSLAIVTNELGSDSHSLNDHFRKGLGFFDLQMFQNSATEFQHILKDQPDLHMIRLFYAISLMTSGHRELANQELDTLLGKTTETSLVAAAWDAKAQMYVDNGQFNHALDALYHVLQLRSDYIDAHVNFAICAYAVDDYIEAANHGLFATTLDPYDALAWRIVGAAKFALREYEEALNAYQLAHFNAPKQAPITIEMAHVLQTLLRTREAEALYRSLLQGHESVDDAYLGLAEINLLSGHYHQAAALLKKRLSIKREDHQSMLWLGFALYGEGEIKRARAVFQPLLTMNPPISLLASTGLSRIAADLQEIHQAKQYLNILFAQKDTKWHAHGFSEFGYLYAKIGQPKMANHFFAKAMELETQ